MVNARHKEVLKASTSKGAELSASDARDNGSSSSFEDLNFRGFTNEETKVLSLMIRKQVGKTIKNVMPYFINQTTDNLKGEEWIEVCTWKEFKELFNAEFTLAEETDKIREEFQTLTQTNESVNEMRKKFNDLIRYCPKYHGNEKLKVQRFQRMLRDDNREVISSFKCTTLDDLLSRARVREADLLRKKNKEAKETKRKLDFVDRDAKKPKQDQSQRSGGTQIKTPCKKCHKTYLGVCRANLPGCYKCGALNHMSKDYKKPMILCYNCNQLGNKLNECPNPNVIEAKPLKSIKEEKVEKTGVPTPTARAYMMATEEDKVVRDVVTVSKVYRDVEMKIDDSVFKIDLIPIVLGAFDI
nr:zinc finger, CCHC-type, retrotransposon Gag domain protein [Tanacetum cinerariifolium]